MRNSNNSKNGRREPRQLTKYSGTVILKSESNMELKHSYLKMTSMLTGISSLVIGFGVFFDVFQIPFEFSVAFWFIPITLGLMAIVTGYISKFKTGIVMGTMEVGIFLLICFLMFFMVSMHLATKHICGPQTQMLSSAIQEYCGVKAGVLPNADTWCDQLTETVGNVDDVPISDILYRHVHHPGTHRRSTIKDDKISYIAFNKNLDGYRLADIDRKTVLTFESNPNWNQNGTSEILLPKGHMGLWPFFEGGYFFIFVGPGSTFTVEFIANSDVDSLNWTPSE